MNILGIGIDIINIKRFNTSFNQFKKNYKKKIFTQREINYCKKKRILLIVMQKDLLLRKLIQKLLALVLEKVYSFVI